jgi:hypothetical protein
MKGTRQGGSRDNGPRHKGETVVNTTKFCKPSLRFSWKFPSTPEGKIRVRSVVALPFLFPHPWKLFPPSPL